MGHVEDAGEEMKFLLAILLALLLFPANAQAFFVVWNATPDPNDPMQHSVETGWFEYAGKIPEDGPRWDIPYFFPQLQGFAFTWDSRRWSLDDVFCPWLSFNTPQGWDGQLHSWLVASGDPLTYPDSELKPKRWSLILGGKDDPSLVFAYVNPTGAYRGTGTWYLSNEQPVASPVLLAEADAVPEPGTWVLLVIGLVVLVVVMAAQAAFFAAIKEMDEREN